MTSSTNMRRVPAIAAATPEGIHPIPDDQQRGQSVSRGHDRAGCAVLPAFAMPVAIRASRRWSATTRPSSDAVENIPINAHVFVREYEACLEHVDAVYIALPNSMHAEYTMRAAKAGVHVLCEKPMAVTVERVPAHDRRLPRARVKLMIAYRLHFEEINLKAVDLVRRGRIGEPKFFNSSFAMTVRPATSGPKKDMGGGTLYDIGVYCINAARYLFRSEPTEVMAISVNSGAAKLERSTSRPARCCDSTASGSRPL